jgi:hypothetical protein
MQPQPGDILIALKAINLVPGLLNNDRRIAATLLDHYNRRTGQCDPGIKRIAELIAISERTVMRGLARIETARLFLRVRHGGHLNRNRYEPNWQRFREIEAVWSARMKVRRHSKTEVSPTARQPCHVPGDTGVTQTCRSNQSKITSGSGLASKQRGNFELKLATPNKSDVARTEAARRWQTDLHREFSQLPHTYGQIVSAIHVQLEEAATDAELLERGTGLHHVLTKLGLDPVSPGSGDD